MLLVDGICWFVAASGSALNAVQSDSVSWADSYIFSSFSDNLEAAVLSPSQSAFPKWKRFLGFCWVLYGPVHESVIMAPWSERPGILTEALVREGFVVKTRSRWLPCRLGSS